MIKTEHDLENECNQRENKEHTHIFVSGLKIIHCKKCGISLETYESNFENEKKSVQKTFITHAIQQLASLPDDFPEYNRNDFEKGYKRAVVDMIRLLSSEE